MSEHTSLAAQALSHALNDLPPAAGTTRLLVLGGDLSLPRAVTDVHFYTPYKDTHDRLGKRGWTAFDPDITPTALFPVVAVIGTRQKQETSYLLGIALRSVMAGGIVITALENEWGGKSLEKIFAAFGCPVVSLSKHKSRAIWTTAPERADPSLIARAIEDGQRHQTSDGHWTQAGIFSWSGPDKGTSSFIGLVPPAIISGWSGHGADFGCGSGDLAAFVLARGPKVAHMTLADYDARALACATRNLAAYQDRTDFLWADIPQTVFPRPFDFIVMNPPFHESRAESMRLGQRFIAKAVTSLKRGGSLTLVANTHLPYEALMTEHMPDAQILATGNGFKILHGSTPKNRR